MFDRDELNLQIALGSIVIFTMLISFFFYHFYYVSFLFYFIFKLYIIVLVLPNIKMNPPQVYMCSFNSRTRHIFLSVYFNLAMFHDTACLSAYMCFVCLGNFIPSYWGRKMETHSSTLAWKIPCTRSLIGYSP